MTAPNPNAPIIIKRIKKGGHGHHGGAWKVAYADFVTAMMAFFLLLWLLSVTDDVKKKGIAEYFTPTTGLKDSLGIGFKGGKAESEDGIKNQDKMKPGLVVGQVTQGPTPQAPTETQSQTPQDVAAGAPPATPLEETEQSEGKESANQNKQADEDTFKKVQEEVMNAFENTPELKELKNNIIVTHTPEGLKIDMVDDQNRPMFQPGSSNVTDIGRKVMKAVGGIVEKTDNRVAIAGHTDASVLNIGNGGYSNWELSADRANASRRFLEQSVIEPERVARVSGLASQDLLTPNEPNSPRNRRISLTLLRGTHMKGVKPMNTSKGLLSVPDGKEEAAPPVALPEGGVSIPPGPKSDDVKAQEQLLQQKVPGLFGTPGAQ